MIRWFARNDIATNFLILAILLWGGTRRWNESRWKSSRRSVSTR